MQKLTCLDLQFGSMHNLDEHLKPLARLKQLQALCSDEQGVAAIAAATRTKLRLPGPISVEDARHWLSRPSEGW
jgi:hypothetical protein